MSIASQAANFSNNITNTIAFVVEVVIFLLSDFVFPTTKRSQTTAAQLGNVKKFNDY